MKNFILILVMLITGLTMNSLNAQGSWTLQTNPTSDTGESIQFVSATEGWISLNSNKLLHTTNAGTIWNIVTPTDDIIGGMDAPGSRISFVNVSTGWVMKSYADGNGNFSGTNLYKTTNGGTSWTKTVLSANIGDAGVQVQFVDVNNGWVLIYNMNTLTPTFLKTTDGGNTWSTTNGVGIFYYVNATTGYAFSAGPSMLPPYTISKTTDGGASWTQQYTDSNIGSLNAIQFTDVNHGWVIGENGKIFKTTDGGASWTSITNAGNTTNYKNETVNFIDNNIGWIATQDNTLSQNQHFMLHTTDGGNSWSQQVLPFGYKVYCASFWDANNGWAASDSGNSTAGRIAKYSVPTATTYNNATLNGPWFGFLNPLDPYNDQFGYMVFDGLGHIIDGSQFPFQTTGTYSVNPDGSFTANLINGSMTVPFEGQLSSPTEAIGSAMGMTFNFHKIANPGTLKDKIVGTLTTTGGCGVRDVTFNIDNNGNIISATGLTGPVTGRVYTDLGVFLGHIKTGEPINGWHLFSIKGYYNNSNNNLTGQIEFDWTSCNAGSTANLVRSDILGTNNFVNKSKTVVYPNPNNGRFCIDLKEPKSKMQVEIYNIWGQKIYEASIFLPQITNEIDFTSHPKGVYLIKINDGENSYREKIMVQ
jgi:photosystem II stability/assembly factor-like uncharacterized protein